jgi:hypothetical protein
VKGSYLKDLFPEENGREPEAPYPGYTDILRHAWPVLWEKPKVLLLFVLFVTVVQLVGDQISNWLFQPYMADFLRFTEAPPEDQERTLGAMLQAFRDIGVFRLFLSCLVPFLFTPLISFLLARGALSLWDGFEPSPKDGGTALGCYPVCLLTFLLSILLAFILSFATFLFLLPTLIAGRLAGTGGFFLVGFLLVVSVFFWCRYLWPEARRVLFIQFLIYFRVSDNPKRTRFFQDVLRVYRYLKFFPSHLNYMSLYTFLTLLGMMLLSGILALPALFIPVPIAGQFVVQFVFLLGMLYPLVGIAGFYRLCLYPMMDNFGFYNYNYKQYDTEEERLKAYGYGDEEERGYGEEGAGERGYEDRGAEEEGSGDKEPDDDGSADNGSADK